MKLRAVCLIAGVLLASSIGAASAQASGKDYQTYLGCGETAGSSGTCYQGSGFGATLEAKHGQQRFKYKICVKPPSGHKWCDKRHTNHAGSDFVQLFGGRFDNDLGTYHATWKVGGKFAGRASMTLASEGV